MCNECMDRNTKAKLAVCQAGSALSDLFLALSSVELNCRCSSRCLNHFEIDQKLFELLVAESIKAGKDGEDPVRQVADFGKSSVLVGDDLNDILNRWLQDFAGGKK